MGYDFLLQHGFSVMGREVAMYMPMTHYACAPDFEQKRIALAAQKITTGRYDPALGYDFDRMCDRGGFEFWRKALQDETSCKNPRPILAATYEGYIVGFTGPVDLEPSGRGWFTGICTDPEFEGRGIATVLFNCLMQEFVAVGAIFSTLFTGDTNHAQRLYRRTGFEVVRHFSVMEREIP
jgi:ribosomal protein S18 acetylase RimI-like enzyme